MTCCSKKVQISHLHIKTAIRRYTWLPLTVNLLQILFLKIRNFNLPFKIVIREEYRITNRRNRYRNVSVYRLRTPETTKWYCIGVATISRIVTFRISLFCYFFCGKILLNRWVPIDWAGNFMWGSDPLGNFQVLESTVSEIYAKYVSMISSSVRIHTLLQSFEKRLILALENCPKDHSDHYHPIFLKTLFRSRREFFNFLCDSFRSWKIGRNVDRKSMAAT